MTLSPLPIDDVLPELLRALEHHPSVVLQAPPGAGKTTRVPPALLSSGLTGDGQIVVLEPRRIAARAAARRIADEQGWRLGEEVGYRIRFESKAGPKTRILVVTEGVMVQMLQQDPFLEGVSALVFDEFHERHLDSDLPLAMAKRVQAQARDDLRLVVMSATLEAEPIAHYLEDCKIVESQGRSFPVDIDYLDLPDPRPIPTATAHAVRKVLPRTSGHLLVFLPGVGEIRRTADLLSSWKDLAAYAIHPLYGDLPGEQQDAVLAPSQRRKVILATNVAETSITIDGVDAVVDSGWARSLRFDPSYGLNRLQRVRISLASADQRAGRAGRQSPGYCLRLWTEHDQRSLLPQETPEIRRLDLAAPLLQLYAWGETNPLEFDWLDAPKRTSVEQAHDLLRDLGALARRGDQWLISDMGRAMARLATHPRLARLLVAGHRAGIPRTVARGAALLTERDIVNRPTGQRRVVAMRSSTSDLVDRLDALDSFASAGYGETALGPVHPGRSRHVLRAADHLQRQARRRLGKPSTPEADDDEALRRALLSAFPDRVVRRREAGSRRGLMVGGRGARLAEMSTVTDHELFLALEASGGDSRSKDVLIRQASAIEAEWLPREALDSVRETRFDEERQRVMTHRITTYRGLPLRTVAVEPEPGEGTRVLAEEAGRRWAERVAKDDRELAGWLDRLRSLAQWMPHLELPTFDDAGLADLLLGLCEGKRSLAEVWKLPWRSILEGSLDHRQRSALERFAPSHFEVPSGSKVRLRYVPGEAPVLAVRIQELFGLATTPTIADGRQPLLLHLLAPNQRPQQVTHDLASFWRNTYPEVRKELYGRYPKHAWPEDPLTAVAESRPGRRRRPA